MKALIVRLEFEPGTAEWWTQTNPQSYGSPPTEVYYLKIFCGQSYKASTGVKYDSTVVITIKLLIFTTLDL